MASHDAAGHRSNSAQLLVDNYFIVGILIVRQMKWLPSSIHHGISVLKGILLMLCADECRVNDKNAPNLSDQLLPVMLTKMSVMNCSDTGFTWPLWLFQLFQTIEWLGLTFVFVMPFHRGTRDGFQGVLM